MLEKNICNKLKEYKRSKQTDILHMLPVYTEDVLSGYLRPLTFDYKVSMPGIVSELSKWRRENPYAGTGTFEVTDDRTEKWLKTFILENEKRILFIIIDLNNRYIGHIGLAGFDFVNSSSDIDAVLRGKKDAVKGIMGAALGTIMRWGKEELQLKDFFLDVFNDNIHAINFYINHGFCEESRIALVKKDYGDEVKWETDYAIDPGMAEKCYIRMKYIKE